ncbi:NADH-quinone oxidoreductase subunit NuoF family protein [Nocardiopsis halophila]|uniref:NADH-quinone oxidoreductase subunit NuoF family protein n=1 Tax=Nocardiopsis halophila TaxID=141692 RepID=UPI0003472806|nr:NADH-quinone oxidoreductase subunit NuoF family protein [Nocardiopsis halophila]
MSAPAAVRTLGPARLTAGLEDGARLALAAHRALHPEPPRLRADDLVALAGLGDLRGRGGAHFPLARKLAAVLRAVARRGGRTRVVVNAAEGEPGSLKDRTLLALAPHLVLDGAELAASALDAPEVVVGTAGEGAAERSLLDAIAERGPGPAVRVVRLPERFLSGEGGALVRGINGRTPIPPGVKGRASDAGVDGLPTLLSNAETFAQLAVLAALGADRFGVVGAPGEPGTLLLTVGGAAGAPAVVEAPLGTPLGEVLQACGAGAGRGVLVGGYHGAWLAPRDAAGTELSRAGLEQRGGALGAGVVLPLGPDACPLAETARVLRYLAEENARQCGPCVRGLPRLARAFTDLAEGEGTPEAVAEAAAVGAGRGACAHPDGAARLAVSALGAFRDDIAVHAVTGSCRPGAHGVLPLPGGTAAQARLAVDWSRCDAHGLCAHLAPGLIRLDRHGYPESPEITVPDRFEAEAAKAADMCPALALRLSPPGSTR